MNLKIHEPTERRGTWRAPPKWQSGCGKYGKTRGDQSPTEVDPMIRIVRNRRRRFYSGEQLSGRCAAADRTLQGCNQGFLADHFDTNRLGNQNGRAAGGMRNQKYLLTGCMPNSERNVRWLREPGFPGEITFPVPRVGWDDRVQSKQRYQRNDPWDQNCVDRTFGGLGHRRWVDFSGFALR